MGGAAAASGEIRCAARVKFLKKEKSLLARRGRFVLKFWHVRQISALEGSQRIVQKKGSGFLLPKLIENHVIGRLQAQRTRSRIVRVAGDKMYEPLADPAQRVFLGYRAKAPRKRTTSDLYEAALLHPFFQAFRVSPQNSVALRMRDAKFCCAQDA